MLIERKLTSKIHIDGTVNKATSRMNQLNAVIAIRSKLHFRAKKRIHEAPVNSIITYKKAYRAKQQKIKSN